MKTMMTENESNAWRAKLPGWSADILPFYESIAHELPNPCTVVEVGSAHGRSAIYLAAKLLELGHGCNSRIFMVDAWSGGWFAECLPSLLGHASSRELELLCPIRATSVEAARMLTGVDMVFIDGDHSRIGCATDIQTWWGHIKPCGIFAGHDYDPVAHPGVVEAVDAFVAHGPDLYPAPVLTRPTRSVWRLR